jgi:hypothetical protein
MLGGAPDSESPYYDEEEEELENAKSGANIV